MSDSERRQRTISSTPRLTPDEVANRTFTTAFRGVSETDVRSFLKRVSEDLAAVRAREQELSGTIDELETRLRTPQPLDEQALLDALGEETTRLLRSAREAAGDIRAKAEERAARLVHEAQEEAARLRQDADDVLGVKTREAETVAEGLLHDAEQRASDLMRVADERAAETRIAAEQYTEELRARVEREASIEVDDARERGVAMLEEAGKLRERIIDDLGRRRELLTGQLEELRTGRDQLLDAYRIVKRTFLEATEALAQVEARATAPRMMGGADVADLSAAVEAEGAAARVAGLEPEPVADDATLDDTAADEATVDEAAADEATVDEGTADEPTADDADESVPSLGDVDDLFARLRAGAQGDADHDAAVASATVAAPEPASEAEEPEIDITGAEARDAKESTGDPAWLTQRGETLAPLRVALVRQVKLAVGDEQNEVLDKVRRHKGRPTAASVLPELDAQAAAWSAVVIATATQAYQAARAASGTNGDASAAVPDDLAAGIAVAMIEPLRDRLVSAIDGTHEPGETTNQVAERIGARYREWKNRSADASVEDALVGAYARGLYDAAGADAVLTWRTPPGGCCPDCTDNELEPTAKGDAFPTGQNFPPAHPGCRCTIVSEVAGSKTKADANAGAEAESTAS